MLIFFFIFSLFIYLFIGPYCLYAGDCKIRHSVIFFLCCLLFVEGLVSTLLNQKIGGDDHLGNDSHCVRGTYNLNSVMSSCIRPVNILSHLSPKVLARHKRR